MMFLGYTIFLGYRSFRYQIFRYKPSIALRFSETEHEV
jgi:hypothetical protein